MDRIRFTSCLAITVIFVIGCASSINVRGINPKVKQTDNYNIGVEQRKTVGEPMLAKESLIYYPGFILKDNLQPPSTIIGSSMMIPKGAKWECKWQDENTNMLCHNPIYAYPYSSIIYLVVDNAYILKGYWNGGSVTNFIESKYNIEPIDVTQAGSFRQELIYNGKSQNVIKVSYREFKDDFARPAFQQDLLYDLSESKEIGFRGTIIEVLEATNTYIKFIVKNPLLQ